MVKIYDNIISKKEQEYLKNIFYSNEFPWFYTADVTSSILNKKQRRPAFSHIFMKDGNINSNYYDIVKKIPDQKVQGLNWTTQSIFGRRGYSIGHYARVVRADLLVMNAQEESTFLQRFFPKDLEHILAELPTDVLIVQSHKDE